MAEHRLDPRTRICLGCCATAEDLANDDLGPLHDCPAIWRALGGKSDTVEAMITPDEELVLFIDSGDTRTEITIGRVAMFDLLDFIDEGITELRDSGHSRRMPE